MSNSGVVISSATGIFQAALSLPIKERGHLAELLLESLGPDTDEVEGESSPELIQTIMRRMREVEEGTAILIDGETAIAELKARFAR